MSKLPVSFSKSPDAFRTERWGRRRQNPVKFQRILVPLDSSPLSDRVLEVALSMAEQSGAKVILLRVEPDSLPASLDEERCDVDMEVIELASEDLGNRVDKHINECHPEFRQDQIVTEIRPGMPIAKAIIASAKENLVDLVVMGTHGRVGISDLLGGSTTERVAAQIPASVFVVRPEGFPYLRE